MKNILKKVLVMLLALTLFLPTTFSAFAKDDDGEMTADEIWAVRDPAYMIAGFNSIEARILGNETVGSMKLVLVREGNALYCDSYTGEIIVLKLKKAEKGEKQDENGYKLQDNGVYDYVGYWTSNPYNVSQSTGVDGSATSNTIKQNLFSQLIIKFTEGTAEKIFYSYKDSVQYGQITTKDIKGGLRVEYVIGRLSVKYLVPEVVTLDRWFDIYMRFKEQYGDFAAKRFAAFYKLYVADVTKDPRVEEIKNECSLAKFSNLNADMRKEYPVSVTGGLAVCDINIKEQERKNIESDLRVFYSFEELDADHAETRFVSTDVETPVFRLALEYTLNKDGVSVRCNSSNVRFDSEKYSLSNILMLPFAGCGNVTNDGYVFSPDGCGTIYDFKDVYSKGVATSETVFGQDYAFSTIGGANKEVVRVPVFGICENEKVTVTTNNTVVPDDAPVEDTPAEDSPTDDAPVEDGTIEDVPSDDTTDDTATEEFVYRKRGFFAIIEKGESLANIVIERQGSYHSYVQTYTSFNPRPKDTYALTGGISAGANALWTVEADRKYTGDFTLKIFILEDEECSYVGMAKKYRSYLTEKGVLKALEDKKENIPLYLETIGAINSTDRFLGIPYEIKEKLTTYANTVKIFEELLGEAKIDNI
ncbi:MAG: hypothetical protein J6V36_04945, partial [Clostridia bacterium]|nr:hypothetical protein [Clostridia bacterium]